MNIKGYLTAISLAFVGTAFAAPNETFASASQVGRRHLAHDLLGYVDYGNGNARYTASWAKGMRFVAVIRHGQSDLGRPDLANFEFSQPSLGQPGVGTHNITAPVPEPETYALMAGGLIVVAAAARRRTRR